MKLTESQRRTFFAALRPAAEDVGEKADLSGERFCSFYIMKSKAACHKKQAASYIYLLMIFSQSIPAICLASPKSDIVGQTRSPSLPGKLTTVIPVRSGENTRQK